MFLKSILLSFTVLLTAQTHAQSDANTISLQIKEARAITNKWMAQKSAGTSYRDLYPNNPEKSSLIISGIPKYVVEVNPKNVVYRHYIGSNMPIILETSQLKTGITPYVIINPGFSREVYDDLVGMFLTTPNTPPEKVGLKANPNADYIDFTLYEGTPVVQIEKEILLIPGRTDAPAWLKTLYEEYKRTGRTATQYVETFKKYDARGGVTPTFMKVKIQSYRMNGKVFKK